MQFIMIIYWERITNGTAEVFRRAIIAAGAAIAFATSAISVTAQTPDDVFVGQIAEPKSMDPATVTAVNDFRN